jgi:hypothetical protein
MVSVTPLVPLIVAFRVIPAFPLVPVFPLVVFGWVPTGWVLVLRDVLVGLLTLQMSLVARSHDPTNPMDSLGVMDRVGRLAGRWTGPMDGRPGMVMSRFGRTWFLLNTRMTMKQWMSGGRNMPPRGIQPVPVTWRSPGH